MDDRIRFKEIEARYKIKRPELSVLQKHAGYPRPAKRGPHQSDPAEYDLAICDHWDRRINELKQEIAELMASA
ncbi:hypothetical protein [Rhizobium sp. BK399]|uniref:hypothetical protein n=1 Tax=Rhizobium sp. BK399 TaxID=2587063 RepID=UPI001622A8EB|nr:hypothetical protein [Rhizobium sp. BK399]MBB3540791.1 hypothetical protein [Rhizobium sp. BK399]